MRGGGRGRGAGRATSTPAQQRAELGYNKFPYCLQEGHWKQDCSLLQGQQRGRGRRLSASRGPRNNQGDRRDL